MRAIRHPEVDLPTKIGWTLIDLTNALYDESGVLARSLPLPWDDPRWRDIRMFEQSMKLGFIQEMEKQTVRPVPFRPRSV